MIPLKDNLRCKPVALVTLILIGLNVLAFAIQMIHASNGTELEFLRTWAVIPAKVTHAFASGDPALIGMAVLTIFTAMFLHGGLMHILGNMLFLSAFGRAVEARLGKVRFLIFYLASGVAAWSLQLATDPTSPIINLGASGAIAGVLGAYLWFWPKAQIKGLLMPVFMPIQARAYWFLLFWIAMQLISVFQMGFDISGGGVAYYAHIGGFFAGLIFAIVVRFREPETDVCYLPVECAQPARGDDSEDSR